MDGSAIPRLVRSALRLFGLRMHAPRGRRGFSSGAETEVLVQRLQQDVLRPLGMLIRQMANAGVKVLYSDHDHPLLLGVSDPSNGRAVYAPWRNSTR